MRKKKHSATMNFQKRRRRRLKTAEFEKLSTSIDPMTAKSSHLKEQVAALQKALAQLTASQAEIGELRQEKRTAYVPNKADMEQAVHR